MKKSNPSGPKRVGKQTETAGKIPFHRNDKLEKIRRHEVEENYLGEHFNKK